MKKQEIIAKLKKTLQENIEDLNRHNTLLEAAEKNGWAINKKITKYLPEGSEFKIQYGMYYVIFPNKQEHLIGWAGSTTILSKESIELSNSCHGIGAKERMETIEDILHNPEKLENYCQKFISLSKTIEKFKKEYEEVKELELLHRYNPCEYELMKMVGVNTRYLPDIFKIEK